MANKAQPKRGTQSRAKVNSDRLPNRVTLEESRDILSVANKDPNRHYRWVNDVNDGQRIAFMQQRGYRIETSNDLDVGEGDSSKEGSAVKKYVGISQSGDAQYAYLMSIPMEYHEEDKAYLAREAAMQEQGITSPELNDDVTDPTAAADYITSGHGLAQRATLAGKR